MIAAAVSHPGRRALAAALAAGLALAFAVVSRADSTPVGPLPRGPVARITTTRAQLVAIALPHTCTQEGLVWRLARPYDARVVRQVGEADVGGNVVLVFRVVGRGNTRLVFALTRGDVSAKALQAVTHVIHAA